jgi:DNA polymerase theta
MSATLPNITNLSTWLHANLYVTTYRPVTLSTYLCINNNLYKQKLISDNNNTSVNNNEFNVNMEFYRNINVINDHICSSAASNISNISTHISSYIQLCIETINIQKSVIIFCPTKRKCEIYSENIVQYIKDNLIPYNNINSMHGNNIQYLRDNIINELKNTPVGLCNILKHTIPYGIAYHHAGLTVDERKVIIVVLKYYLL